MEEPTVDLYMTPSPVTIGHAEPLSAAHRAMRAHSIRHLPVMEGDELIGLLSLRDLHLFELLDGEIDLDRIPVREAMSSDVYAVEPGASVREVAAHMAQHKLGSAVVLERGRVVGIFTAIDGLRGLSLLLSQVLEASR